MGWLVFFEAGEVTAFAAAEAEDLVTPRFFGGDEAAFLLESVPRPFPFPAFTVGFLTFFGFGSLTFLGLGDLQLRGWVSTGMLAGVGRMVLVGRMVRTDEMVV